MSGWTHSPWRGHFYPEGLGAARELAYASRQVNSIEVNGTFYRLQTPKTFARWYSETPPDFRFSVKASRYMTHGRRIDTIGARLPNFLASGLFALREKLGPILWQFPPTLRFDVSQMEEFLAALPHDTTAAERLTMQATLPDDRALRQSDAERPLLHAVEIRHPSFLDADFTGLLDRYNVAGVITDSASWPSVTELTGSIIYARLQGAGAGGSDSYPAAAVERWADRLRTWAHSAPRRDVYAYFDVGVKLNAPMNAASLLRILKDTHESVPGSD